MAEPPLASRTFSEAGKAVSFLRHVGRHFQPLWALLLADPRWWFLTALGCLTFWRRRCGRSAAGGDLWKLARLLSIAEARWCPVCRLTALLARLSAQRGVDPHTWFAHYRPDEQLLKILRAKQWPPQAPSFSILMHVGNTRAGWLQQALGSAANQTYSNWELICLCDASAPPPVRTLLRHAAADEPRIKVIELARQHGLGAAMNVGLQGARGEYTCFLGPCDALEPQALHRFAETVLRDQADVLYGDEVLTGRQLDEITAVIARPQFCYDYFLSHPYFSHPLGIRTSLVRAAGGIDVMMPAAGELDLLLRVLERGRVVSHVPDVLYRRRSGADKLPHAEQAEADRWTIGSLRQHLARLGYRTRVRGAAAGFYDVAFTSSRTAKVAILIPSKNQENLLRRCIDSLERTVQPQTADIYVIDHESDDPRARAYLNELQSRHRVMRHQGVFNFSTIINRAVDAVQGPYTHWLLLNNDTEAVGHGWLEHMLGLGCRQDVGIVGATLVYPNESVQHAGIVIGPGSGAKHVHWASPLYDARGLRNPGYNGTLLSNRQFSAVTGACMLVRSELFAQIGGFDERLVVGFGDVDFCLRAGNLGYKVLVDAQSVLIHHECVSRGRAVDDPYPADTELFRARYAEMIRRGDPFYSPLLSSTTSGFELNPTARCTERVEPRTVAIALPRIGASHQPLRWVV